MKEIENLRQVVRDVFSRESISMLVEGNDIMRAIDTVEVALGREKCKMNAIPEAFFDDIECSACGVALWGFQMDMEGEGVTSVPKFCPNCGRKVER